MSHQEMGSIEYANQCRMMLDNAEENVRRTLLDIEATRNNSSRVIDSVLGKQIYDIISEGNKILIEIENRKKTIGSSAFSNEIANTHEFLSVTNGFYLRSTNLNDAVSEAFKAKMADVYKGRNDIDDRITTVTDERLASLIRLLARNKAHSDLSFDELKEKAESILDPSKKVKRILVKENVDNIKNAMAKEKLDTSIIEKIVGEEESISPLKMMNSATDEIIDERLRRSAIQAIIKSISGRGFIVNRSNIRHLKDSDTVRLVAKKPAGQTAEFLITLDGKFQYHFQGYEGAACEKDISPMEKDLEDIYGIKFTDKKTLWENPDKHNKMYHQKMNVRRDS